MGGRRRWTGEEKRRTVEESHSGLASVPARGHSNQLLFVWRNAYREGRLGDVAAFVPAVVVPEPPERLREPAVVGLRSSVAEADQHLCSLRGEAWGAGFGAIRLLMTASRNAFNRNLPHRRHCPLALTAGATGFNYTGVFGSDLANVSVAAGSAAYSSAHAGLESVNVSGLSLNGSAAANYRLSTTSVTGSGTIAQATITVTGATGVDKTYDSTTALTGGATGFNYTGVFGSDLANVSVAAGSAAYSSANAGVENVNVSGLSLSGSAAANYRLSTTSVTGSGTITPAMLTVTALGNTKTYDGTNSAAMMPTVLGLQGSNDSVTGLSETYATPGVGTGKTLNVASYLVNDGNGGNNYTIQTVASVAGVIN
ncbi:MAG TPA: YDG domain-containing protein, partial [Pseudolabrys sp.]